jgi:hypothetical protein
MADVLTVDPSRASDPSRVPDILRRTVPWVRLMSVMLFISCGVMVLGGLAFGIGLALGMAGSSSQPGPFGAAPAVVGGFFYACMGLINLIPAVFLWRFANHAKAYAVGATAARLEQALDAQRSYWKFMGIFMIVAMVLMLVVGVIAGIGAAIFMRAAVR